ncbi:glycosyltransferase [Clostridium butyricum]|jgi:uncharacterized protein (TIGR00661 family)|uniref:glycosyltransferase n=1 Tax=Clostridium butyricum TaxID=1492 RepID=UPI001BA4E601|nr:nucleotide disphospho-sugar-binding domain-containing protein [Clostridium butyricum]MDU1005647.1 glycosyltransferase [Clostridium butyricum]QUF83687.1 UDP-glucoronosyl and UDP-glucosyl transferase [Clostridium butyricum]
MRVLILPMSAMAETNGTFSRVITLSHKLLERNHEVALCAAEDINYRSIENVKNYYAPIPSPLEMPMFIGKNLFKIAQFFGVQQKRKVNSFEEVLHLVGALNKKHFYEDVFYIRKAIQDFKPDLVYAEFRLSAIVASKLENIKVITGYSYPVQKSFASNPEYSIGIKEFLQENNLPPIESVLDIFNWADLKVVPSSYELEPIDDKNIVFTGPFSTFSENKIKPHRNKVLVYMGNGTITPNKVINTLNKSFKQTAFQVYIATHQVKPYRKDNITVNKRFDFNELMPETIAYINHGGQNSIMTGLIYGVPQIICPGNVFERRYNAASIVNLSAGVSLEANEFNAEKIINLVNNFSKNPTYSKNSKKVGNQLLNLGGVNKLVNIMEDLI